DYYCYSTDTSGKSFF
nr:immunoglobulin light chain junction region [Macaca mulatta]